MRQALKELFKEDFEKEYETVSTEKYAEGHAVKLIEQVYQKIAKGKAKPLIAEGLEEDGSTIKKIYDTALNLASEFDTANISKILYVK